MAPITVGDALPEGTLSWFDEKDELQQVSIHSLSAGKKIVLFGVPGAFTLTCSMKNVFGFIENGEVMKSMGVGKILCISANDPFLMKVWAKTYPENKHVKFLTDSSASYTHALGLELNLSEKRAWHPFPEVANIEERGAFMISGANEILKAL